jgi:hypothetical protein
MKRIYTTRCKIKYPHDFEDYPCKKCNGIILDMDKVGNIILIVLVIIYVGAIIINIIK